MQEKGRDKDKRGAKKIRKLKTTGLRSRSISPTKMVVPDLAARAYGLIGVGGGPRAKAPVKLPRGKAEGKKSQQRVTQKSKGRGRGEVLSPEATELFDLAMQSPEFRAMMQLYTGLEDPTAIIEKYARLWTANPLYRPQGN